jgi:hypothetical protein
MTRFPRTAEVRIPCRTLDGTMTMLQAHPRTGGTEVTGIDVRRVGVRTIDGRRGSPSLTVPLRQAARLAEADRLLGAGHHLLLLAATATATAAAVPATGSAHVVLDVTLVDDIGDPVWMGALPVTVGDSGTAPCLPTADDAAARARRAELATVMTAAGFLPNGDRWFSWRG